LLSSSLTPYLAGCRVILFDLLPVTCRSIA
jgi:hypothetical protein